MTWESAHRMRVVARHIVAWPYGLISRSVRRREAQMAMQDNTEHWSGGQFRDTGVGVEPKSRYIRDVLNNASYGPLAIGCPGTNPKPGF